MKNRYGFGLIESLIVVVIIGISLFAGMQLLQVLMRGQQRVDVKSLAQNLETRIRNLLSAKDTCTATLVNQLSRKIFNPGNLSEFNNDPVNHDISLALGDGTFIRKDFALNQFKVDKIQLKILNEVLPPGSGEYEANLMIFLNTQDQNQRELAGGALTSRVITLLLTTTPDTAPNRKITGCSVEGESAAAVCEAIGGQLIKIIRPNDTIDRCYFGGDLKLNQYECVDPAEFLPGKPLEGAGVEECYFRSGTRMLLYRCFNSPKRRDSDCLCQQNQSIQSKNGWVVKNVKTGAVSRNCNGGVMIKVPDDNLEFLMENEYADNRYVGTAPSDAISPFVASDPLTIAEWVKNWDILDTVTECVIDNPETLASGLLSIRALSCKQEEKSTRGDVNSCVFINHGRAKTGTSGTINQDNYSGWVRVTTARTMIPTPGNNPTRTIVKEAVGRKCFMVKRQVGSEIPLSTPFTSIQDPIPGGPTNILTIPDRVKALKECIYLGDQGATLEPAPVFFAPFQGKYVKRFPCDPDAMNDVDINNLTGDVNPTTGINESNPTLNKGTCWYFHDVNVQGKFSLAPGVLVSGALRKFRGWMYLTRDLPDRWFNRQGPGGTAPENSVVIGTGSECNVGSPAVNKCNTFKIDAIPCNLGVRITQ